MQQLDFPLDLFLIILICVCMCLYVINCLYVYFGWDYCISVLEGYYSHFRLRGILVILWAKVN